MQRTHPYAHGPYNILTPKGFIDRVCTEGSGKIVYPRMGLIVQREGDKTDITDKLICENRLVYATDCYDPDFGHDLIFSCSCTSLLNVSY